MVGQYQGPDGTAALAVVAPVWNVIYSLGLLMGILTVLFNRQIMRYLGADALAVYGPVINVSTFVQCCAYSVGQAAQPILSTNFGARQSGRIRETLRLALGTTAVFGAFWTALSLACPNLYIRIFMDATPEIFAIAPGIIHAYALSFFAAAVQYLLYLLFSGNFAAAGIVRCICGTRSRGERRSYTAPAAALRRGRALVRHACYGARDGGIRRRLHEKIYRPPAGMSLRPGRKNIRPGHFIALFIEQVWNKHSAQINMRFIALISLTAQTYCDKFYNIGKESTGYATPKTK